MTPAISVVLCTYNRAHLLRGALDSLLQQDAGDLDWELALVDNNSTDGTRAVAEALIASGARRLRYVFEPHQGLSHARNAGIAAAASPIIAFTDDDVRVTPGWLSAIAGTFDRHPEIEAIGGRVLPVAHEGWPAWATSDHWAPLGLADYGDRPIVMHDFPRCLVGATFAFRRRVFSRVGMFAAEVQREGDAGVASADDAEMTERLWRAGVGLMYVPDIVVHHVIAPERLTKAYHRRWHTERGRIAARLADEPARRADHDPRGAVRLLGVPAWMLRAVPRDAAGWALGVAGRNPGRAFLHEVRLRYAIAFCAARWREHLSAGPRATLRDVAAFAGALARRVVARRSRLVAR